MPDTPATDVRLVRPTGEQLRQVARLRWDWALASGREPHLTEADFVTTFEAWWRNHNDSHRCVVGLDPDGAVVAFEFVALTSRVPGPHVPSRFSADPLMLNQVL